MIEDRETSWIDVSVPIVFCQLEPRPRVHLIEHQIASDSIHGLRRVECSLSKDTARCYAPGSFGSAAYGCGVRFHPVRSRRRPASSPTRNARASLSFGVDRNLVRPVRVGAELAAALTKLFPGKFEIDAAGRLFGSADGVRRIKAGEDPAAVAASWSAAEARWRQLRAKYLLY